LPLRTIAVTRYVTPLREGGSLPAIVEGNDLGTYVLKFRGAGQGPKALIAELVCGEIARALGLPIPELVLAELDVLLARSEPDPEIQALLKASAGLNLALDYLPGAIGFDPALGAPPARLASEIVWFDALVTNVDRTLRNPNLLVWHKQLYLIDHGAALYFQHDPSDWRAKAKKPFVAIADHVLLPFAAELGAVDDELTARLTGDVVRAAVAQIPDAWLDGDDAAAARALYADYLCERLVTPRAFAEEALRAYAKHV
jgi:hypothetical protein